MSEVRGLASELLTAPPTFQIRRGVVTAVNADTVDITIGDSSIPLVPYDTSYSPTVDDVVNVFFDGPTIWVQGKLSTS